MLSIAIKEENSHFEHGLKIIISHLANQWHQEICYQIPIHTRRQHRVVICNRNDKDKLMFRPCLYMLPLIYREDDVEEMTKKLVPILQKRALRNNVPATICHYCTTRNFSVDERKFLMFLASGYTLAETAHLLSISDLQAKATRRGIMKKLHVKNDQQFLRYIRAHLNFLQN